MSRTICIRLMGHSEEMRDTILAFVGACNEVSWHAVLCQEFNSVNLHKDLYYYLRETWDLKAQMACTVFRSVAACYKQEDKKKQSKRRNQGVFFQKSSMPLQHGRDWSFRKIENDSDAKNKLLFSISTLKGRVLVEGRIGAFQRHYLDSGWEPTRAVLVSKGSEVWIHLTLEKEAPTVENSSDKSPAFAGVDLGQNNLAVFDLQRKHIGFWKGGVVKDEQRKSRRVFQSLQSKGTRGARRKLRSLGGKQRRWQKQQNHLLANAIVKKAKTCGANGIVLEDLKGIRQNGKRRTAKERADFHGWSFGELRRILTYKAIAQGLSVHLVNPYQTSKICPCCHAVSSHRLKHRFRCQVCHYELNADLVGARNIAQRASA